MRDQIYFKCIPSTLCSSPGNSIFQLRTFAGIRRLTTPEENFAIYGTAANPHGHGHNYEVEVTLAGEPIRLPAW